jgi:gamma-glutamyl hydrolase
MAPAHLCVLLLLHCGITPAPEQPRAVIAVFTQQTIDRSPVERLAASYVKWVEQAGARVVPIRRADDDARVAAVMARADGLLFPGGYGDAPASARLAYSLALASNARGVPVPVWGTCLGFEWLMQICARDPSVLRARIDAENISLPLELRAEAASSRMLGSPALSALRAALASRPLTMNNHDHGVTPDAFEKRPALGGAFRVLSTSTDRKGLVFVSTVEARALPIFATQWHPEKAQFEWAWRSGRPLEAIDHSDDALAASQHLARVFVQHARSAAAVAAARGRAPLPDDWWSQLIWRYPLVSEANSSFVQTYLVGPAPAEAAGGGEARVAWATA